MSVTPAGVMPNVSGRRQFTKPAYNERGRDTCGVPPAVLRCLNY